MSVMSMALGRRARGSRSTDGAQVDDLFIGLRDAVVALRNEALHVGLALGVELHPADVVAAFGQFGELVVGADLGGRKLVEIDGDHRRWCRTLFSSLMGSGF